MNEDLTKIKLHDFIGQDSGKFSSYQDGLKVVNSLKCINDCSERGVKLGTDFLPVAKIEQHYQNIPQIAENDCHMLPNQRKRKQSPSKCWFSTLTN